MKLLMSKDQICAIQIRIAKELDIAVFMDTVRELVTVQIWRRILMIAISMKPLMQEELGNVKEIVIVKDKGLALHKEHALEMICVL